MIITTTFPRTQNPSAIQSDGLAITLPEFQGKGHEKSSFSGSAGLLGKY
jgi:hypothetical protein